MQIVYLKFGEIVREEYFDENRTIWRDFSKFWFLLFNKRVRTNLYAIWLGGSFHSYFISNIFPILGQRVSCASIAFLVYFINLWYISMSKELIKGQRN